MDANQGMGRKKMEQKTQPCQLHNNFVTFIIGFNEEEKQQASFS